MTNSFLISKTKPSSIQAPSAIPSSVSFQRLQQGVQGLSPALAGIQIPSDAARLQGRLDKLEVHANQASAAGHDVSRERDALEKAAKALESIRDRFKPVVAGGAGLPPPPTPPNPTPNPNDPDEPNKFQALMARVKSMYAQQATSNLAGGARVMGGAGAGGLIEGGLSMLGGASSVLAPIAIGTAVVSGFNAATNALIQANTKGRNEITGSADLARQYDYSGNPLTLFRDSSGMSVDALRKYNYTARDAAKVACPAER